MLDRQTDGRQCNGPLHYAYRWTQRRSQRHNNSDNNSTTISVHAAIIITTANARVHFTGTIWLMQTTVIRSPYVPLLQTQHHRPSKQMNRWLRVRLLLSTSTIAIYYYCSQLCGSSMPDCGVRGPRFESHCGQLCLSRQPLRYTSLGRGCAPLLHCLGRLSLPLCKWVSSFGLINNKWRC